MLNVCRRDTPESSFLNKKAAWLASFSEVVRSKQATTEDGYGAAD